MAQIEIIGDDNYVLINDEFKNLVLAAKRTITFPSPPGLSYLGSVTSTTYASTSAGVPVIAINSAFYCSQTRCYQANGVWTIEFSCPAEGVGRSAEVYIFHLPQSVPDAGGLVQLFNEVGELVFDSNLTYMKMETSMFITMDHPTTVNLTAGRKYAAIQAKLPAYYSVLPGSRPCGNFFPVSEESRLTGTLMSGASVTANIYLLTSREYCTNNPSSGGWRTREGLCFIIDVTGQ